MLLTPVTLAVAASVLTFLLDVLHESMKFEAAHALRDTVRLIAAKRRGEVIEGKPESGQQKVLVLTAEQMALVRRTALEKAILLKLPEEQATLLADAMVGSLSLSPT